MAYLYDTCAVSEFVQALPNPKVIAYLSSLPNQETFKAFMSIGEIRFGIELLPPSTRRQRLNEWYTQWVLPSFHGRMLTNDLAVMERWATLTANLQKRGLKMSIKDSLIAACALSANLKLITRNEADFAHCGVQIINPWKS